MKSVKKTSMRNLSLNCAANWNHSVFIIWEKYSIHDFWPNFSKTTKSYNRQEVISLGRKSCKADENTPTKKFDDIKNK